MEILGELHMYLASLNGPLVIVVVGELEREMQWVERFTLESIEVLLNYLAKHTREEHAAPCRQAHGLSIFQPIPSDL